MKKMNAEKSETLFFKVDAACPDTAAIEAAAALLRAGGVVAFPTETVYGLGADALNAAAVQKIFIAKGRPADNPLIVHLAAVSELGTVAAAVPDAAYTLAAAFWPGPLTLVLPRTELVPDVVTGGLDTVAVRIPDHPVALALIRAAGRPLAAPSANLSGRPSPTNARHVMEDMAGRIGAVIDGGETGIGVESTVLDLTGANPMILRPGGLTREKLQTVIPAVTVDPAILPGTGEETVVARSPGVKYKHYAPRAEVVVVEGSPERIPGQVRRLAAAAAAAGKKVGIIATAETASEYGGAYVLVSGSRENLLTVSHNLFSNLRQMDAAGVDLIVAEGVGEEGLGLAIMNRLRKAAAGRVIRAH